MTWCVCAKDRLPDMHGDPGLVSVWKGTEPSVLEGEEG